MTVEGAVEVRACRERELTCVGGDQGGSRMVGPKTLGLGIKVCRGRAGLGLPKITLLFLLGKSNQLRRKQQETSCPSFCVWAWLWELYCPSC